MKTWIIIALVLSTCVVQVDGGLFRKVGKFFGKIVKPILGIDKLEKQAEHGRHSVESGIATFNNNIANSLRNLDTYVKNEIIPEVKKLADSGAEMARSAQDISNSAKELVGGVINTLIPKTVDTMDTAQDMMEAVSDNVDKVGNAGVRVLDNVSEVVIPEFALTMQYFRWMMVEFVNSTQNMQEKMGRSLDNIEYISGIVVAISFIVVGLLCGYALRQIEYVFIPNGFVALEINVLKSIRMVAFASALLVVLSIILKILQISLFSTPNRLLFFLLFPILFAFSYHYNRFLLFIFQYVCIGSNYASLFIRYVLFIPYLAPFVLTYNCFVNRHNHPNRIGKVVIYCLPPAFCVSYFACINVVEKMLEAKNEKIQFPTGQEYLSIAWVYSLFLNFILLYIIALVLKLCYGANHQENVRAELSSNENFYNG